MIAGTGRAGTSFLVRFLAACGLETGADDATWFERARAGGEHALDLDTDLPYVVKDPWLWVYCRSLDLNRLTIDALVVPMRDLSDAAASRVLQERAALTETHWIDREHVDVYANTPGGVVYSLSVADQARILAVGFHELLHWSAVNDIPVILLDFPRIVEDGEYVLSRLHPVLDGRVDRAAALAAHAEVADAAALRVRSESRASRRLGVAAPLAAEALDRAALVLRIRELEAERDRLAAVQVELAEAREQAAVARVEHVSLRATLGEWLAGPLRAVRRRV